MSVYNLVLYIYNKKLYMYINKHTNIYIYIYIYISLCKCKPIITHTQHIFHTWLLDSSPNNDSSISRVFVT